MDGQINIFDIGIPKIQEPQRCECGNAPVIISRNGIYEVRCRQCHLSSSMNVSEEDDNELHLWPDIYAFSRKIAIDHWNAGYRMLSDMYEVVT